MQHWHSSKHEKMSLCVAGVRHPGQRPDCGLRSQCRAASFHPSWSQAQLTTGMERRKGGSSPWQEICKLPLTTCCNQIDQRTSELPTGERRSSFSWAVHSNAIVSWRPELGVGVHDLHTLRSFHTSTEFPLEGASEKQRVRASSLSNALTDRSL